MFPTQTDLDFWESKRQPAWAARIKRQAVPESWKRPDMIDNVVNAHAGLRFATSSACETHNMCAFVKGWLRRGEDVIARLLELVANPQGPNPPKRAALARKWARRLGVSL